mmetsp:Transcript_30510/g.60955  ORF Transcript_30510/g.60955 Transcript_30510/m.60955 type:complete len:81 (+) Transcript_30510:1516-1758(+)
MISDSFLLLHELSFFGVLLFIVTLFVRSIGLVNFYTLQVCVVAIDYPLAWPSSVLLFMHRDYLIGAEKNPQRVKESCGGC